MDTSGLVLFGIGPTSLAEVVVILSIFEAQYFSSLAIPVNMLLQRKDCTVKQSEIQRSSALCPVYTIVALACLWRLIIQI